MVASCRQCRRHSRSVCGTGWLVSMHCRGPPSLNYSSLKSPIFLAFVCDLCSCNRAWKLIPVTSDAAVGGCSDSAAAAPTGPVTTPAAAAATPAAPVAVPACCCPCCGCCDWLTTAVSGYQMSGNTNRIVSQTAIITPHRRQTDIKGTREEICLNILATYTIVLIWNFSTMFASYSLHVILPFSSSIIIFYFLVVNKWINKLYLQFDFCSSDGIH